MRVYCVLFTFFKLIHELKYFKNLKILFISKLIFINIHLNAFELFVDFSFNYPRFNATI